MLKKIPILELKSIRQSLGSFPCLVSLVHMWIFTSRVKKWKEQTTHDSKPNSVGTEHRNPVDVHLGHLSRARLGNTYTCAQWKEYNWPLGSWPATRPLLLTETKSEWANSHCSECPLSSISPRDPGVSVSPVGLPQPTSTGFVRRATFQKQLGAERSGGEDCGAEEGKRKKQDKCK